MPCSELSRLTVTPARSAAGMPPSPARPMALYPQSTTARSGAARLMTVVRTLSAVRNGWSGMLSTKAWSQKT